MHRLDLCLAILFGALIAVNQINVYGKRGLGNLFVSVLRLAGYVAGRAHQWAMLINGPCLSTAELINGPCSSTDRAHRPVRPENSLTSD